MFCFHELFKLGPLQPIESVIRVTNDVAFTTFFSLENQADALLPIQDLDAVKLIDVVQKWSRHAFELRERRPDR